MYKPLICNLRNSEHLNKATETSSDRSRIKFPRIRLMQYGEALMACIRHVNNIEMFVFPNRKKKTKVQTQYDPLYEQNLNWGIARRLRKQTDRQ